MRFRLQALVHQGQPEELDIVPKLVRSRAVIAVATLAVVIAAIVVWSFLGNLPRKITVDGLLATDAPLQSVPSTATGVVTAVQVAATQNVSSGQVIATVTDPRGAKTTVTSPFAGRAVTVSAAVGLPVQIGTPLVAVQGGGASGNRLHAALLVSSSKAAQLAPGQEVDMSVDSAPSAAFGLLRGKVQSVSPFPLTSGQALSLLGNDALVRQFVSRSPTQLVTVTVDTDSKTKSGYSWTTHNGPPFPLLPQTLLKATVRVGNEHPIHIVFGN